jgi:hypothetical protein
MSAAKADVVHRVVAATAVSSSFFMALPLAFVPPPEGRWFEEDACEPSVTPVRWLACLLSRKTNDIPRSAGKEKPAAIAAFLGVLTRLQMIDTACCFCDTD